MGGDGCREGRRMIRSRRGEVTVAPGGRTGEEAVRPSRNWPGHHEEGMLSAQQGKAEFLGCGGAVRVSGGFPAGVRSYSWRAWLRVVSADGGWTVFDTVGVCCLPRGD